MQNLAINESVKGNLAEDSLVVSTPLPVISDAKSRQAQHGGVAGIPPVIIIGMHRSGTTMITQLLQRLGLYLGWMLQENSEALFFVDRNDKLMNVCGGAWDHPEPVENLVHHGQMRDLAVAQLRRDTESLRAVSYLGPRGFLRQRTLSRINVPWGWKDPRNTYLLPLWLDLFPEAKIIHIYRHPMDVAKSLQRREQRAFKERTMRLARGGRRNGTAESGNTHLIAETGLLYVYRRLSSLRDRFSRLSRYDKFYVPASLSLAEGVRLWTAYVGKSFEVLASIPNKVIHLKYEEFLDAPEEQLDQLKQFCGLPGNHETVSALCRNIRSDRRYAFKCDECAWRAFVPFKDNEWVRKLGYNRV